jgi:cyclic pyranopterin phosphate synthase
MKMLDVGSKAKTERVAVAEGHVKMSAEALERIRRGTVEKGDVIAAARLAGIMAAKHTPDIIPLCHPIGLSSVEVEVTPKPHGVDIEARVKTVERTGVEMEALAAVSAAALTVYDMLKSVDRGMLIEGVQLLHKSGGRSGTWNRAAKPAVGGRRRSRG